MTIKLVFAITMLIASALANASGMPDTNFGKSGALILDLDRQSADDKEDANSVIVDAQDRYVVTGEQRCSQPCGIGGASVTGFLARYLHTGAVDPTFNAGQPVFFDNAPGLGLAAGDVYPYRVLEQTDGRLLVGGRWRNTAFVCRFLQDGTVDVQFAQSGCREFEDIEGVPGLKFYSDIALQGDGRILVLAQAAHDPDDLRSYALARLTSEGSLDASFGNSECPHCGVVRSPPGLGNALCCGSMALALDPYGGRIVVAGRVHSAPFLGLTGVRIKSTGEYDQGLNVLNFSSFVGGEATHGLLGVEVNADSSVHMLGTAQHGDDRQIAIGKVSGEGMPDAMFGNQGRISIGYPDDSYNGATALVTQSDGKFVFAGEGDGCEVTRVNPDGSVDLRFGIAGRIGFLPSDDNHNNCRPHALAADDRYILVAGRIVEGADFDGNQNALLFRLDRDGLFADGLEQ